MTKPSFDHDLSLLMFVTLIDYLRMPFYFEVIS